jgi:hypothetical protein
LFRLNYSKDLYPYYGIHTTLKVFFISWLILLLSSILFMGDIADIETFLHQFSEVEKEAGLRSDVRQRYARSRVPNLCPRHDWRGRILTPQGRRQREMAQNPG